VARADRDFELSTKDRVFKILTEAPNAESFFLQCSLILGMSLKTSDGRVVLPKSWLLDILEKSVDMVVSRSWTLRTLMRQTPDSWEELEWAKPIARCWKNLDELARRHGFFDSLCEDLELLDDFMTRWPASGAVNDEVYGFPKAAELFRWLASMASWKAKGALCEQKLFALTMCIIALNIDA